MSEFNDIEALWNTQSNTNISQHEEVVEKAKTIRRQIKRKHRWTITILLITMIILFVFFISVSVHNFNQSFLGAFLMVIVLFIRITMEHMSWYRYRQLDITDAMNDYVIKLSKFYRWRKKIHMVYTPLIIVTYFFGFVLLTPYFKEDLSKGFYTYVKVSGILTFLGLSFFIFKQIKNELATLKFLQSLFRN